VNDYRSEIVGRLATELTNLDWIELPDMVREHLGYFTELTTHLEQGYTLAELPNGKELIIGFGDTAADMWDGTIYWQLQHDSGLGHYSGEITNGSPRYVLWSLFEQLEEALKKGAN